jgi:hypothetical protein
VIARVARSEGADFWAIAERPYHETLAALIAIEEVERVEDLRDRMRDVNRAALVGTSVLDPGSLDAARAEVEGQYQVERPERREVERELAEADVEDIDRVMRIERRMRRKKGRKPA